MSVFIHETAIVEPGARVGEGTKIWHHTHVMSGAAIGAGAMLGKGVFVAGGAVVGDRVRVQNGVSLFDGVTLEEDVFVGPHAVFTNVKRPRVGERGQLLPTRVGRGATIGAGAVIVCGHELGTYALVGAGAVVTRDVAPHALVVGNPARRVGWVSRAGERLPEGRVVCCPKTQERYLVEGESCRMLADAEEPEPEVAPVHLQELARETTHFGRALGAAFARVSSSAAFVLGAEVNDLERALCDRLGVAHAIGVSSGTDALLASLMALGIGPGDEVITTPLSFFASTAVILRVGAKPVFVDVDPHTWNLDPLGLRAAVTTATKAILPVHLFGHPLDPALFDEAAALGVPVIEDAAQAMGASTTRGAVGGLGALGCFSFFPTKNLAALGDGGLVVTQDAGLAERVRTLRAQGAKPKYNHLFVGGNFRLDALQAAFLSAKLPELDALNAARRSHAATYDRAFAELRQRGALRTPRADAGHVYHQYVVQTEQRDALREFLSARAIETGLYYPRPIHLMPALEGAGHAEGAFPNAERVCSHGLALPVHPFLHASEQTRVIQAVVAFFA